MKKLLAFFVALASFSAVAQITNWNTNGAFPTSLSNQYNPPHYLQADSFSRVTDANFVAANAGAIVSSAAATNASGSPLAFYSDATLSNIVIQSSWFPNQTEAAFRTPPLGVASWYGSFNGTAWTNVGAVVGISNELYLANQTLYPSGYRYLQLDDGWSTTNLDANNLAQMSPSMQVTFGTGTAGVANFINAVHTNGWKVGLYMDGTATSLSSDGFQHGLGGAILWTNVATLCRYGLDAMKNDQPLSDKEHTAAVIGQNGYPIYLHGSAQLNGTDGPLLPIFPAFMNGYRAVSGGDITSYTILIRWCDVVMTNNWWAWVRPGHFIDMDYVGGEASHGGFVAAKTHFIIDALFSAPIWDDTTLGVGAPLNIVKTNAALLAINQDPAVICAQRYLQTNNCDVYVKPLGSPNGPQYALGVVNRDQANVQTVTLQFTNLPPLNRGDVQSWSAFDCVSNAGWVLQGTNGFTVTLGTNDSILWRLVPGAAVVTNYIQPAAYNATLPAMVISNGVQSLVNVPWDTDATNFIARAQLTNDVVQCFRVQFYITKLKAAGLWSRMDAFYPVTPGSPYLNAVGSAFPLVPTGAVTTNALGIAGNGSSSYFTNGFIFSSSGTAFTKNSASLGIYSGTQSPTVGGVWAGGADASENSYLQAAGASTFTAHINGNTDITGSPSDFRGLFAVSRIGANSTIAFMNGSTTLGTDASVGLPVSPCAFGAFFNNSTTPSFFSNVRIQAAWIGGGYTAAELAQIKQILDEGEAILGRRVP